MNDGGLLADVLERMLEKDGTLKLNLEQAKQLIMWIKHAEQLKDQSHIFLLRLYEELGK